MGIHGTRADNARCNYLTRILNHIKEGDTSDIGRCITVLKANDAGIGKTEEPFSQLRESHAEYESVQSNGSDADTKEALSKLNEAAQACYDMAMNNHLAFIIRYMEKGDTRDIGRCIAILESQLAVPEELKESFSQLQESHAEYESAFSKLNEAAQAFYDLVQSN